ncbi:helix-turn-helix domain-containing protein [Pseudonocardia acaciae]|uniref:helix-turn-helix domain-containing protein n=1 Tax=Pseudonocardia acaciae TaxID=551276 RepID=UPI00048F0957
MDEIDVGALLAEPLLRNTLVAGLAGVHRTVRWCLPLSELDELKRDAEEPPDQGVVVHAHAARLRGPAGAETITAVAGRGVVAVLVQTEPADVATPGELPFAFPEARRAADRAGLPLALLPPTAGYRAVSQLVATKVLAQATHVLQYSDRVHRSLGEILARGAGISPLAYGMARMSVAPVMVLDLDGAVLAYEATSSVPKPDAGAAAEPLARHLERLCAAPPARAEVTILEPFSDTDAAGASYTPIVAPVMYGGETSGLAAVLEPDGGDAHDRAQRRIVAAEGAVLIGSEMLRIRSMTEAEERIRGDFVVGLVHGRFQDGQQLLARARHHGFNPDGRHTVCVAAIDPPLGDDQAAVRRLGAVARAAENIDAAADRHTLATQIGGHLVVVRQIDRDGSDALSEQELARRFAGTLRQLVADRLRADVRVTFGRVHTGASGVSTSYREARTALGLARRVDVPPLAGYDELRIFVALRDLADSENGRAFAREILTPLRKADGHGRGLESVALAYVGESANLNAAARRLGLHRNTTLYKLERVSRALGMDIRSADTQFMVWLAHHIDSLVQVTDALDAELAPPP